MGFSYRGNTRKKGKSGWFNYSASSKGYHASYSQKITKNSMVNVGKHGVRATINFGNGLRWTGYRKHTDLAKGPQDETTFFEMFMFLVYFVLGLTALTAAVVIGVVLTR